MSNEPNSGDQPKIIIDSDWKQQAQAEKEKLRQAEQERQAQAAGDDAGEQRPIAFADITRMLATQALMYLGAVPDPQSGKAVLAPDMARAYIDMLGILEEKTKGNLDEDEGQELSMVTNELRTQFVEVAKAIDQAIAEGKITPEQMGGLGGGMAGGMGGGGAGPVGRSPNMPPQGPIIGG